MGIDFRDSQTREEFRAAIRDAIDAWLDKQFATFGKWSAGGVLSIALAALAYLYFTTHGLSK